MAGDSEFEQRVRARAQQILPVIGYGLGLEQNAAQSQRALELAVQAELALLTSETDIEAPAGGGPSPIPVEIVEQAVLRHVQDGFGRRRLDALIPGLTVYQAGQVLAWYRVGKPAGLWLEDGRLKWGNVISATPDGLRLPRL